MLLLFLTLFSVLVANPKKTLYTVANPARGLLNRKIYYTYHSSSKMRCGMVWLKDRELPRKKENKVVCAYAPISSWYDNTV